MTGEAVLPDHPSPHLIRFGLWLYAVGLGGSIVVGFVGPPKIAGAMLAFAGLGWYFVAAFSVLDRMYLLRADAPWSPDPYLRVGCLIPFLNVFSGYFYLQERAKHVPRVVDLERHADGSRHA